MTTGDQVLAFLAAYDLQQTGTHAWRCNSPLRQGSNSHSFTLDLDPDGEHGAWHDHVAGQGGSLYVLRDMLGLPKATSPLPVTSTKRAYKNLDDYAAAHGVSGDVFRAAGWRDDYWFAQPALSFPTPGGARYRLIDGGKDTYIQASGYKSCLYGLTPGLGRPLVLCNGEASTVVAQHYGVPAFCQNMGEKKLTARNLAELMAVAPPQPASLDILIALDCDDKGRKVAGDVLQQLQDAGYGVRAVDLGGGTGFDLADFCRLWQNGTSDALLGLSDVVGTPSVPSQAPPTPGFDPMLIDANQSDAGNAEVFGVLYGHMFRYDHTRRKGWYIWDGSHWKPDVINEVNRYALMAIRNRYAAAALVPDFNTRKRLSAWAIASESAGRQRALLEFAQSQPPFSTTVDTFDCDLFLAGVYRQTLDLRSCTVRTPNPAEYITMQFGTHYDAQALCPTWLQFIDDIFSSNQDTIRFVQRAIGYSLTGDMSEQKVFLCFGEGANGKSVLLKTIMALLGDYAANTSFATFDGEHRTESTNDLAKLRGKRFVTIIETNEDRRLDEAKVKAVTGGDPISCRFLYGEFFTYTPTFKIWLAMNHKPVIRGMDRGIWRRIVLIPFLENFEARKDKYLDDKLLTELPGILNWALAGLKAWQRDGLGSAPSIDDATTDYRRESDELAKWLLEATVDDPQGTLVSSEGYGDYNTWSRERGERHPMTQTSWGRGLSSRGYVSSRQRVNSRLLTVYSGIRLRNAYDL